MYLYIVYIILTKCRYRYTNIEVLYLSEHRVTILLFSELLEFKDIIFCLYCQIMFRQYKKYKKYYVW